MRNKIKVEHQDGYETRDGDWVDYYNVGNWSLELINSELDEEVESAKHSVKVFKAWHQYLKRQRRKNK